MQIIKKSLVYDQSYFSGFHGNVFKHWIKAQSYSLLPIDLSVFIPSI